MQLEAFRVLRNRWVLLHPSPSHAAPPRPHLQVAQDLSRGCPWVNAIACPTETERTPADNWFLLSLAGLQGGQGEMQAGGQGKRWRLCVHTCVIVQVRVYTPHTCVSAGQFVTEQRA